MLLPKRVKYRRVHRGRMTGKAMRGNTVSQGDFGIVALEPSWITSNQIEAVRFGSRSSRISPLPRSRPRPEWAPVKAAPSTGWPW